MMYRGKCQHKGRVFADPPTAANKMDMEGPDRAPRDVSADGV